MQWEFIVALVIVIPVILFPAAFVWYLNIGGIYAAIKEAREKRAAGKEKIGEAAEADQHSVVVTALDKELVETRR